MYTVIKSRFGLVIGCLVLSVMLSSDPENKKLSKINYIVDAIMLFQYILEFSLRVWVVGCNAKYKGFRDFGYYSLMSHII